ncbi:RICIN domain-containing protein [Streptomyces sp. NPDC002537]
MNVFKRAGSVLGAAVAAVALCGGAVAASPQPVASGSTGSTLSATGPAAGKAPSIKRTFTLTSMSSNAAGKCLDVWDWGNGPWIQVWGCHGGSNQSWNVTWNSGSSSWTIRSNSSGKCVDGYRGRGNQLVQYPCDNTSTQSWNASVAANGAYRFENRGNSGQCMDIYDWGRGNVVQLWDCGGQDNQWWSYN